MRTCKGCSAPASPRGHWCSQACNARHRRAAAERAILLFGIWLRQDGLDVSVTDVRAALAGRNLACWCPLPKPGEPDFCHAAVLLRVANTTNPQPEGTGETK